MKKTSKRIISLISVVAMVMCLFSSTAFAAEPREIPSDVEKHTITVSVGPGESFQSVPGNEIMPMIWNNPTYGIDPNGLFYTAQFTVPDRYFAYEMVATASNGAAISDTYEVAFMYHTYYVISSMSYAANGVSHKNDWINIPTVGESYCFRIKNPGTSAINVTITYYSWK